MKNQYFKKIQNWMYIAIIFCIVMLDIFSKRWIINHIQINQNQKIFSLLNFLHIHNYGAAFSFLSNQTGWQRWFLSIISFFTVLVIIGIIITSKKKEPKKISAYSLIIAGAIGNLFDRIIYGYVIDFIDIHIRNSHFATFNIADCSIFIGILILTQANYEM